MRVFVIAYNIFKNVGGGETVYQHIIRSLPDVEFTYLTENVKQELSHPANAQPITLPPLKEIFVKDQPAFPQNILGQLREADRIARAVAGQKFDIVDIPDYMTFGAYLRSAFRHHSVDVGRIVLAMHGNISTSIHLNYDTLDADVSDIEYNEKMQFICADDAYSISKMYIDEWSQVRHRNVQYIDPMCFVNYCMPVLWPQSYSNSKVNLCCIGRSERIKGNDIFVDINRWISTKNIAGGRHIGSIYRFANGVGSDYHLSNLAKNRSVKVPYEYSKNRDELNKVFSDRTIVVLPTRYDTLNLVVLEALFSGCPVAISNRAGVCRYLDENYPELPYIKIDFADYAGAINKIEDVAADYDAYRRGLYEKLSHIQLNKNTQNQIRNVYESALAHSVNNAAVVINYEYRKRTFKEHAIQLCRNIGIAKFLKTLKPGKLISMLKDAAKKHLSISKLIWIAEIREARNVPKRYWRLSYESENTAEKIYNKIHSVENIHSCRLFHCYAYYELSRLLEKLNNFELMVTYELRAMRLSGRDIYGHIETVVKMLDSQGFVLQAKAVELMYDGKNDAAHSVYDWLKLSYKELQHNPSTDSCDIVRDFRNAKIPRVSVIVSLYNAADKLEFFIKMLLRQTLVSFGEVEFIFIDSCSPMDEYSVLDKYGDKMNMLYLRSFERETIQKAWNRALPYARGEYITFLGVDEIIYPDALELLSKELDNDPELDWVVGNSLIEAVDMQGVLQRDVMLYDRRGGIKFSSCFDTCYLTYVGGLYRKSVHTRFGYYNENYRGAGDTEFKNRILKHIKVKYIDRTLGIFLDYPQERITASSMAEIEDISAWYIYRTLGGVRYTYELSGIDEIEQTLKWGLIYRKSFRNDQGSDIEYSYYIARYLLERDPDNELARKLLPGLELLLSDLQELDSMRPSLYDNKNMHRLHEIEKDFDAITAAHRNIVGNGEICYTYYNDNRYHQHRWLWPSEPEPCRRKGY